MLFEHYDPSSAGDFRTGIKPNWHSGPIDNDNAQQLRKLHQISDRRVQGQFEPLSKVHRRDLACRSSVTLAKQATRTPLDGSVPQQEVRERRRKLSFDPIRVEFSGGILQNANALLPITPYPTRRDLLLATASGEYTALFDSYINGGDSVGSATVLAERLATSYIVATSIPFHGEPGSIPSLLGGVKLIYGESGEVSFRRSVSLIEGESGSSRYHFEEFGPAQPWENTSVYTARRKRDRFTPEMLREYCLSLGINAFDTAFYTGPACLIERTK